MLLLALVGPACAAQSCPTADGAETLSSTLTGTIHHHRQLRDWIGIDLSSPTCGEKTIQIIFVKTDGGERVESLDGCSVRVTGSIYESPTGYYSAPLAISDPVIEPLPGCHPQPLAPTQNSVPLPANLRSYSYSVVTNVPGNVPITGKAWRTEGKPGDLEPWSAYASFHLNGAEDFIWAVCRDGFTPLSASSTTKDEASMTELFGKSAAALSPSQDHISRFVVSCRRQ
ncbi:MAG: hypothetical protein WA294_20940 [Acidobacteriaceae bacterium]